MSPLRCGKLNPRATTYVDAGGTMKTVTNVIEWSWVHRPALRDAGVLASACFEIGLNAAAAHDSAGAPAGTVPASTTAAPPTSTPAGQANAALGTVTVEAPEPRFVAPTRRDRIGRIWAPVFINGKGPFRLALDSCADTSGITKRVAQALGISTAGVHQALLHGGVGSATVPLVPVTSFNVGDLSFGSTELPIVPDALGGADGVLGTSRMEGRRIMIDFHHDLITITRSHGQRAADGYLVIPFTLLRPELIVLNAYVGNVRVKAIIDTGGQTTIANLALRTALERRRIEQNKQADRIEDVTKATMPADSLDSPPILIDAPNLGKTIQISNDRLTFADMAIFDRWHINREPAVLIGMNTLGQLDMLIIDYQRKELQIRMSGVAAGA
jgi:Aspartyl protease